MKISVCIPAYKNADYLKRNLDALCTQTFKDFEVIVSDDSPDDSLGPVINAYASQLELVYFKNDPAMGTPANWNLAMEKATGQYIKLIHDDDWLAEDNALQQYYDAMEANPDVDFCFSAFYNVQLQTGEKAPVFCSKLNLWLLRKSPYNLFRYNFIGPPSGVFVRNKQPAFYDDKLKWLVDFEGYIRQLNMNGKFIYLDQCLVNIGLGAEQVTQYTKMVKEIVVPESCYVLQKHQAKILNHIWVYDFYWRMLRNLNIKSAADVEAAGWEEAINPVLLKMISFQQKIPGALLKAGPVSKLLMFTSYLIHR